jgi:hypothetical protein
MLEGPPEEERAADGLSGAGEIGDERDLSSAAAELGRKGGQKRAENMTPERRRAIARAAAAKRWGKGEV